MTIQTIGQTGIAILIDETDLRAAGTRAGNLTLEKARPIVSTALIEAGVRTDGIMEIEAFQNGESVLIFARVLETEPQFFSFPDLEALLRAVLILPAAESDSSLTYLDGEYVLTLSRGGAAAGAVLTEFGEPRDLPARYLAHLREHGKVLLPHDAVARLQETFD